MDQDPAMPGAAQSGQNDQPNHINTSAENASSGNIPDWITNNPAVKAGATGSVVEPVNPPKKSHTGLIVLIVILVLLVLGIGGLLAWYFLYYNNPNRIAYDAIEGFLRQDTVLADGMVTVSSDELQLTAKLVGKTNGKEGESTLTLGVSAFGDDGEPASDNNYEIDLSHAVMSDGVIYFRIDRIADVLDQLILAQGVSVDELDDNVRMIYDAIEQIDGEWWRISIPDLIDEFAGDIDEAIASKEAYICVNEVLRDNVNGQIADIYSTYPFVNIVPNQEAKVGDGRTQYDVEFDYDEFANFMNATTDAQFVADVQKCMSEVIDEDDYHRHNVTADGIRSTLGDVKISMIISNFRHELEAISVTSEGNVDVAAFFNFSHPVVTIEAPEKYRPITDLMTGLTDVIETIVLDNMQLLQSQHDWRDDYDSLGLFGPDDDIACDIYDYQDDNEEIFECLISSDSDDDWWTEDGFEEV